MNKTKYMQTDSRWGSLGYPKKPYYLRNCGCGEVSIANIIIEMDKYASYTPATIQPYCKQYADPKGNGTYWSGIPAMMKHYGLTEVKEHATMSPLWTELAKGDRVAIYLMGSRKGGSKGVKWTSGGHFVCSVGYQYKNGKHMVYVKDSYSNSSLRNGWISYEENMRNDVLKVWSGKLNKAQAPKPYSGEYPNTTVKTTEKVSRGGEIVAKAKEYAWPKGTASSKSAYKTGAPVSAYKTALKKYMNKTAKVSQSDCGYFVSTCVRASGIASSFLALPGSAKDKYPAIPSTMELVHSGSIGSFNLQPGDVIRYRKTNSHQHTVAYIGSGMIAHAGRSHWFPKIVASKPWTNSNVKQSTIQIIRPKPIDKVVTRNYIQRGDRGEDVKKLQKYINWFFHKKYGKDVLAVDGIYGHETETYCKLMQSDLGFKDCDGLVGPKTVAAMKGWKQ